MTDRKIPYSQTTATLPSGEELVSLVVKLPGYGAQSVVNSHPNFETILELVRRDEEPDIKLFNPAYAVELEFNKITSRVVVRNGKVYFDNDEVNSSLTGAIINALREKADFTGLAKFFENLAANPQSHSREFLYDWLGQDNFTITDDGHFIGYKGVSGSEETGYKSSSAGHGFVDGVEYKNDCLPNYVGAVVEMPRSEVTFDPTASCSKGLHVGTHRYAQPYASNGALMKVKVNPRDVVSVPQHEHEKMRVCRYEVVEFSPYKATTQVWSGAWGNTIGPSEDEEEPFYCDECGVSEVDYEGETCVDCEEDETEDETPSRSWWSFR